MSVLWSIIIDVDCEIIQELNFKSVSYNTYMAVRHSKNNVHTDNYKNKNTITQLAN
jgi:hypothetical protein